MGFDKDTGTALGITPVFGSSPQVFAPPTSTEDLVAKTASFIDANPVLFGASSINLGLIGDEIWGGKAWMVDGTQQFSGLRVLDGYFKLVLALDGTLLHADARTFPEARLAGVDLNPVITEDKAIAIVLAAEPGGVLSPPSLVIAFRKRQPVVAWKVELTDPQEHPWLFVIAGDNGEILIKHAIFDEVNVQGDVRARGTDPNSILPDAPHNPPTTSYFPLPESRVHVNSGSTFWMGETDSNGSFSIPVLASHVTVTAEAISTPFSISTLTGPAIVDSKSGPAGSYFQMRLNQTPAEFTTSQVNAFVWMEKSRDFADLLYASSGLVIPGRHAIARVNDNTISCGASHTRATVTTSAILRFSQAGGACVNRAYATPVAHEFGHHFTREVNIQSQNQDWGTNKAKKEGTADVFCAFLTRQSIINPDYMGQGTFLRDLAPDVVFPAGNGVHEVGVALGGSFWDLRAILMAAQGSTGEIVARDFFTRYVDMEFKNITPTEVDERAGEKVVSIDQASYGGFYRQSVINAFLPHNLYRLNFIRGDCNGDGTVNVSDATAVANVINGSIVPGCFDACDAEGDNDVDDQDQLRILSFVFVSGSPPPAQPFPGCGRDQWSDLQAVPPVPDFLTCLQSTCPN